LVNLEPPVAGWGRPDANAVGAGATSVGIVGSFAALAFKSANDLDNSAGWVFDSNTGVCNSAALLGGSARLPGD
jgi:hypothetical protein